MKPVDFLILAVLAVLFVLAVRYAFRRRNQACGDCSSCPYHASCTKKEKKQPPVR